MAAVLIGIVGGALLSAAVVGRLAGLDAWLALPWAAIAFAALAATGRLALGITLATFWLLPLILAAVLLQAWLRRWGLVVLAAGVALGSGVAD